MRNITDNKTNLQQGKGYIVGLTCDENGYEFTCEVNDVAETFLLIYDNGHNLIERINMNEYCVNSSLSSVHINNLPVKDFTYCYESQGVTIKDKYVRNSQIKHTYGAFDEIIDEGKPYDGDFDWEGDKPLRLDYNDIIAYQLHVRGFTMHKSSKLGKHRGTYLGVIDKIPHMLELGVNQIVLMPTYEYDECEKEEETLERAHEFVTDLLKIHNKLKINYWGFKEGFYYMPKAAFGIKDSVKEFKLMVKELHKAGIEVVMRFYFPESVNKSTVIDILKYWVREYHIDGFFLMGIDLPMNIISTDLYLRDVKIYSSYWDNNIIRNDKQYNHNLAQVNDEFLSVSRRFLKSDENMLHDFLLKQRLNPSDIHVVNYITNFEGFTLSDLVSYDYKHNEDNLEENRDGTNYNYSWNCGAEGSTKRKSINILRNKQIKNALTFLLLAQGVPMLLAGDEFLNSQNGNNNTYCQDNEKGWVVWKDNKQTALIKDYIKKLIELRMNHPVLHPKEGYRLMDYAACGFPDLSYHGDNAWAPKFDNYYRHIGVMMCGKYARIDKLAEDDFFYIAYNMHWDNRKFGLPKLPKGLEWEVIISTDESDDNISFIDGQECVTVTGRTIVILKSKNIMKEV